MIISWVINNQWHAIRVSRTAMESEFPCHSRHDISLLFHRFSLLDFVFCPDVNYLMCIYHLFYDEIITTRTNSDSDTVT